MYSEGVRWQLCCGPSQAEPVFWLNKMKLLLANRKHDWFSRQIQHAATQTLVSLYLDKSNISRDSFFFLLSSRESRWGAVQQNETQCYSRQKQDGAECRAANALGGKKLCVNCACECVDAFLCIEDSSPFCNTAFMFATMVDHRWLIISLFCVMSSITGHLWLIRDKAERVCHLTAGVHSICRPAGVGKTKKNRQRILAYRRFLCPY